jgi:hypothetical protein
MAAASAVAVAVATVAKVTVQKAMPAVQAAKEAAATRAKKPL